MPLEFPESELEAIAAEMDQVAKYWTGDGKKAGRLEIAAKWTKKARLIRQAIDAYRERVNAPPITRRQQFAALVDGLAGKMTAPDRKSLAAGDR